MTGWFSEGPRDRESTDIYTPGGTRFQVAVPGGIWQATQEACAAAAQGSRSFNGCLAAFDLLPVEEEHPFDGGLVGALHLQVCWPRSQR